MEEKVASSPTTGVDPGQLQTMIGKHKDVKGDIDRLITQAQNTVESDLVGNNSGQLIAAVNNVFETWKGQMQRVQGDFDGMIEQLQNSLNQTVSGDETQGQSVNIVAH